LLTFCLLWFIPTLKTARRTTRP